MKTVIEIVGLNKKQLKGFTTSEAFKKFEFAPISELREISHIANPRATGDDILLFLAYEGEELTGYLGILPDDIAKPNGEVFHFGWFSTLYVSEKHRGKQIAQKLLYAAEAAYNGRMMITEFTDSAHGLYKKIGLFDDLQPKQAVRYYFKSNLAEILPAKKEVFNRNKKWILRFDKLINPVIPYLSKSSKLSYSIAYNWDDELKNLIDKQTKNPLHRSSKEFEWILKHPWLSTQKEQPNYLFSSYSTSYQMFWVKLYENGILTTCFLCSIRNSHLKVLYYFTDDISKVAISLPAIIKNYKVKMMTIYDDQLNEELAKGQSVKALYKRYFKRNYLITKTLKQELGADFHYEFADGDGDFSFT